MHIPILHIVSYFLHIVSYFLQYFLHIVSYFLQYFLHIVSYFLQSIFCILWAIFCILQSIFCILCAVYTHIYLTPYYELSNIVHAQEKPSSKWWLKFTYWMLTFTNFTNWAHAGPPHHPLNTQCLSGHVRESNIRGHYT